MKNSRIPLSGIGLNKYEEIVYLILVEEGMSTAKTISDITGIPYGKVYEVTKSLSNKGFLTILPTKPTRYLPVSPKEAISNRKKHLQEKFEKIETQIIKELEPIFTKTKKMIDPKSNFLILNGRATVNKKIEEFIKKSQSHINVLISENGLKRIVMHRDLLKSANKRGVKITISAVMTPDNKEDVEALSFCNFKSTKKAAKHLFSVDGDECILIEPKEDDENLIYGRDIGIWIVSKSFTEFFDNFFNLNFKK